MENDKWLKKRKWEKIGKILISILLSYLFFAAFFDFRMISLFFALSLLLGIIVVVLEVIQLLKERRRP